MTKKLVTDYTFTAATRKVALSDFTTVRLEGVLLITNVTDGIIIYNFADPSLGGSVVGNILTLAYDTTPMSDSDDLQIWYDDGGEIPSVDLAIALRNLNQSLVYPSWVDPTITRVRSTGTVESGTVSTITNTVTVTNMATFMGSSLLLVTAYTFNALARTITLPSFTSVLLYRFVLITNVTAGIVIYDPADPTKDGIVTGNAIRLGYDTTGMGDTDILEIYYDDVEDNMRDDLQAQLPVYHGNCFAVQICCVGRIM